MSLSRTERTARLVASAASLTLTLKSLLDEFDASVAISRYLSTLGSAPALISAPVPRVVAMPPIDRSHPNASPAGAETGVAPPAAATPHVSVGDAPAPIIACPGPPQFLAETQQARARFFCKVFRLPAGHSFPQDLNSSAKIDGFYAYFSEQEEKRLSYADREQDTRYYARTMDEVAGENAADVARRAAESGRSVSGPALFGFHSPTDELIGLLQSMNERITLVTNGNGRCALYSVCECYRELMLHVHGTVLTPSVLHGAVVALMYGVLAREENDVDRTFVEEELREFARVDQVALSRVPGVFRKTDGRVSVDSARICDIAAVFACSPDVFSGSLVLWALSRLGFKFRLIALLGSDLLLVDDQYAAEGCAATGPCVVLHNPDGGIPNHFDVIRVARLPP